MCPVTSGAGRWSIKPTKNSSLTGEGRRLYLAYPVVCSEDPDGGWVDTHHFAEPGDLGEVQEAVKEMVLDDEVKEADGEDSDEEAIDMEDFVESGMLEDDSAVVESTVQVSGSTVGVP